MIKCAVFGTSISLSVINSLRSIQNERYDTNLSREKKLQISWYFSVLRLFISKWSWQSRVRIEWARPRFLGLWESFYSLIEFHGIAQKYGIEHKAQLLLHCRWYWASILYFRVISTKVSLSLWNIWHFDLKSCKLSLLRSIQERLLKAWLSVF